MFCFILLSLQNGTSDYRSCNIIMNNWEQVLTRDHWNLNQLWNLSCSFVFDHRILEYNDFLQFPCWWIFFFVILGRIPLDYVHSVSIIHSSTLSYFRHRRESWDCLMMRISQIWKTLFQIRNRILEKTCQITEVYLIFPTKDLVLLIILTLWDDLSPCYLFFLL